VNGSGVESEHSSVCQGEQPTKDDSEGAVKQGKTKKGKAEILRK